MKKKILIDATLTMPGEGYMGKYVAGIGQAAIALLNELDKVRTEIPYDIQLYASTSRAFQCDFSRWHFKHHALPIPSKITNKGWKLEARLRSIFIKSDLFHITGNYADVLPNEPFIVTIHDCTDMDAASSLDVSNAAREILQKKYQLMTHASRAIVTDSDFSKTEILKYFNVNPDKVIVNYLGIDREKYKILSDIEVNSVLKKHKIMHPYFFACSCSRPRKNLITALRAFRKFRSLSSEHIFVVAWGNPFPEILKEFEKEIKEKAIIFLPFLTDEEIVALYNGASMSVYVSRKEGFGFPILESFACGTPCMTCRNSSLPEVGQNAAIYVGEDDIDEMVDVMRIFEKGQFDMNVFRSKSEPVLNQFSWFNTAKRCLDVYEKCL